MVDDDTNAMKQLERIQKMEDAKDKALEKNMKALITNFMELGLAGKFDEQMRHTDMAWEEAAEEAAKLAAQPVQTPATPAVPVAEISEVRAVVRAAKTGKMINLGELCRRLGFSVTADFLASLGFWATIERNAKMYQESDFTGICDALIVHLEDVKVGVA